MSYVVTKKPCIVGVHKVVGHKMRFHCIFHERIYFILNIFFINRKVNVFVLLLDALFESKCLTLALE
jgi:hypothetical protein